jgi:hypothetical protein
LKLQRSVKFWWFVGSLLALAWLPTGSHAAVPYPECVLPLCADPYDYAAYLFLPPGILPNDYAFDALNPASGGGWKYAPGVGMDVTGAWGWTTGRPDVVIAVLDSGIRWTERQLAAKLAPNRGELPEPCPGWDCDGNGVVNPDDWAGVDCGAAVVSDLNGNGHLDGQDLIVACQDGYDDDANGFVDDIAGWDFFQGDNDPFDDVDAGHGTGEGEDMVAVADDGTGFPGVAPSAMFVPLRVGDHFVALEADFAQAVVYAVEIGVDVVSEALGALGGSELTQVAVDYAYYSGVPVIASAADEQSYHHNWPAVAANTIWVNSIRNGDGTFVSQTEDFGILNGCTNHGGKAWVAISSTSCSSEATGRAAGITALLISHGKNRMDLGLQDAYPGSQRPFSAEEVRQIFRAAAQDVDRSADPPLSPALPVGGLLEAVLSGPTPETEFRTRRFPTHAGWDQYTGYGRADVARMLEIVDTGLPPEAAFSGRPAWFDVIDPSRQGYVHLFGSIAAVRTSGRFDVTVEVGCGVAPDAFTLLRAFPAQGSLRGARLVVWQPARTAEDCGFDPAQPILDPDAHTVTLRLRVIDDQGRVGEDRRTVAIHTNTDQKWVTRLGASGEGSINLADIDRDAVLDVVVGTADGRVHVLRGDTGKNLPGFPVRTDPIPSAERIAGVDAFRDGVVSIPHEALLASVAVGDLDRDGRMEIVAASVEGKVYVFTDHGGRRAGFPVHSDPALSAPERRDRWNDVDPGFASSPALVDLDAPDGDPDLEIVIGGLDGHVYAWHADGTPVAGFPARLGDTTRLIEDPVTGKWLRLDNGVRERLAKILSSPAVGDLDGDGRNEIVIGTNEEYVDGTGLFSTDGSPLLAGLGALPGVDDFSFDTAGRMYALGSDGSLRPGFPVRVPMLAPGLLPTVATGTPGSPALARLTETDTLVSAIASAAGPLMLFDADGAPFLGLGSDGAPRSLALDFPGGFPNLPDPAGLAEPQTFSFDAPFLAALGSPAFGDVDGDGAPEVAAPTGGLRQLLDVAAPASQEFGDHQVSVWNPIDGAVLPGFPRIMEDMQFFTEPALADVDGDGRADVVQGSGGYQVRAYRSDGSLVEGWPKFTHGWLIGTPAVGDVDGDGLVEVVASTREGSIFVWDSPAPATASALPWPGFGHDRRNTRNLDSGVGVLAPPRGPFEALGWWIEAFFIDLFGRLPGSG